MVAIPRRHVDLDLSRQRENRSLDCFRHRVHVALLSVRRYTPRQTRNPHCDFGARIAMTHALVACEMWALCGRRGTLLSRICPFATELRSALRASTGGRTGSMT